MIHVEIKLNEEEMLNALQDMEDEPAKRVVRDYLNDLTEKELAGLVIAVFKDLWDEESAQECADMISKWKTTISPFNTF